MTPSLPERPNLEQIRNQAKGLLKAHRANDPAAIARVAAQLPLFPNDRPSKSPSRELLLADALFVVAREHGLASWPKLKAAVEKQTHSALDTAQPEIATSRRLIEGSAIGRYTITREMGRSIDRVYETADSRPGQPIVREIERSNDVFYQAWDPLMGRRVAIKVLVLPEDLSDTQKSARSERFQHEAKATGSHPNIVTIHDVGEDNGRHFIAMEYLEGHTLREILGMQKTLPAKETIQIALQICAALGDASSRVVVHRDVKPDKIFITPGGVVKLTGFGASRPTWAPHILAEGQATGTPEYMAPEQIIAGPEVGHSTDLFFLGVCMYEMLTGIQPFQGDTLLAIADNVMATPPVIPDSIPQGLQAILQKALMKDPNLRYHYAGLMVEDLRAGSAERKPEHPSRKADETDGASWLRFTERARKVIFYTQEESGRFGENSLSTEYVLLGLTREYDHVAGRILERIGISREQIRSEIERQIVLGAGNPGQDMNLTPSAMRGINLAWDEAKLLNNNYIGTEHLLLGLIRDDEGIAGRVLAELGVTLDRVRKEIRDWQAGGQP